MQSTAVIDLPWARISTVFLDMDGTLLDLHFDNYFWLKHVPKCYAQKHGISVQSAEQKLFPKMLALRGQLDWYCTDYWTKTLGLPIILLKQEVSHLIKVRPYVREFLAALKNANKQVILFTNAHEKTVALKFFHTGLDNAFDLVVTSHEMGIAKESEGVWHKLSQQHSFDAKESLFIDDNFSVLDQARNFGIGYLLGISKPDSTQENLSHKHYTLLNSFAQIMP